MPTSSYSDDLQQPLILGVVISLLVHIVVFGVSYSAPSLPTLPDESIDISLEKLISQSETKNQSLPQQIVETSQSKQVEVPPPDAKLLTERNAHTDKEQVKRGDSQAGQQVSKVTKPVDQPPQKESARNTRSGAKSDAPKERALNFEPRKKKSDQSDPKTAPSPSKPSEPKPRIKSFSLDEQTLLDKFSDSSKNANRVDVQTKQELGIGSGVTSLRNYAPFSRPMGSGAQFIGRFGTNDMLPSLPDGDITLLNEKADQFAVFVRRVATRVFSALRSSGWETLSAAEIASLQNFATVRVELSPSGEPIRIAALESSGSTRFDGVLSAAARQGARDPHPPQAAAAANGNIIFLFKARSWVEGAVNRRTGAPVERRWLMLAVGLE